jgi:hypothetical protein
MIEDELSTRVLSFVAAARRSPAAAVSDDALEGLMRVARRELADRELAHYAPVTRFTWMGRTTLLRAEEQTAIERVPMGERGLIVGFIPTLQSLGPTADEVLPPLDAVDVSIELRSGKDLLTHRFEMNVASGGSSRFVALQFLSMAADEGNRLVEWPMSEGMDPNLAFQFRWAIDSATRVAANFADVQISLGLIWLPLRESDNA